MGMFKKKQIFIILIALLLLVVAAIPFPIMAATQNQAGFYVHAILPDNQLDDKLSYFDLRIAPNQTQDLEIEITNQLDTDITIAIDTISASTNRNGIIDYKTPDIRDETLLIPFSTIATVSKKTLLIPAMSSKIATIRITIPDDSFDGVILGGLVFTRQDDENTKSSASAANATIVNNIFSYVIGVKLSENDIEVLPEFELAQITATTVNYHPAFIHAIRNTKAVIAKGMTLDISVKDTKGIVVAQASHTNIDMAPNSIMDLSVVPDSGQIKPGDYFSDVLIKYGEQSFSYKMPFTVTNSDSDQINEDSVVNAPKTFDFQVLVFYIILSLLLAIIIILIILLQRKRGK